MAGQEPDEYRPRRALPDPEAPPADAGEPAARPTPEWLTRPRGEARPPARHDEDAPTVLPRGPTGATARPDLASPTPSKGRRTRFALLVAAVAAVVIVGLALGYAALGLGDTNANPTPGTSASTAASLDPSAPGSSAPSAAASSTSASGTSASGPAAPPAPESGALLSDASMLSPDDATQVDDARTWKVASTQRGLDDTSPRPACVGEETVEGQPTPQQRVLRLLSSNGKRAPTILHQAEAYLEIEEAAQAYALTAKALGGCAMSGAWVESGARVSGLGDQAVGVTVRVGNGSTEAATQFRTVVLSRTGRVLDILDAARPAKAVALGPLVDAAAAVTNAQCKGAGGRCAPEVSTDPAPPPLGGDQPGFLAAGDLPPVGAAGPWAGSRPTAPSADFTGSQCERVDWAKVGAKTRATRAYIPARVTDAEFGLDEIVLTRSSAKSARSLVNQVKDDLTGCAKQLLTAEVADPDQLKGVGAQGTAISGWATTVAQKTGSGTVRYRVGIVAAGPKVVYTFLSPQKGLDLSDKEFAQVTLRAGERATQVR